MMGSVRAEAVAAALAAGGLNSWTVDMEVDLDALADGILSCEEDADGVHVACFMVASESDAARYIDWVLADDTPMSAVLDSLIEDREQLESRSHRVLTQACAVLTEAGFQCTTPRREDRTVVVTGPTPSVCPPSREEPS